MRKQLRNQMPVLSKTLLQIPRSTRFISCPLRNAFLWFDITPVLVFWKPLLTPFYSYAIHPCCGLSMPMDVPWARRLLWCMFSFWTSQSNGTYFMFFSRFTMSTLLMPPPYNFSSGDIGLMEIAAIIGFVVACFGGGYMSDIITTHIVKKSKGEIRPEQRLISLLPGIFIAPAGCILLAFACQYKLNWVAIAFGFGMGKRLLFTSFARPSWLCMTDNEQFHLEKFTHQTSLLPMWSIAIRNMPPSVSFSLTFSKIFSLFFSCTRPFPGLPPRALLKFIWSCSCWTCLPWSWLCHCTIMDTGSGSELKSALFNCFIVLVSRVSLLVTLMFGAGPWKKRWLKLRVQVDSINMSLES